MTTNELDTLLYTVAEADNSPEIVLALKPFLPAPAFEALALSIDMCPIHNQDLDSCADDDTDNDENEIEGMQPLNTPVLAACRHLRTRP